MKTFKTALEAKNHIISKYTLITKKLVILSCGKIGPSQGYTVYGYIYDDHEGNFKQVAVKGNFKVPKVPNSNEIYFDPYPFTTVDEKGEVLQKEVAEYIQNVPESLASIKRQGVMNERKATYIQLKERAKRVAKIEAEEEFLYAFRKFFIPRIKDLDLNQQAFILSNIERLDLSCKDLDRLKEVFNEISKIATRETTGHGCSYHGIRTIGDLNPKKLSVGIEYLMKEYQPENQEQAA